VTEGSGERVGVNERSRSRSSELDVSRGLMSCSHRLSVLNQYHHTDERALCLRLSLVSYIQPGSWEKL
jgi:hypothetical protein